MPAFYSQAELPDEISSVEEAERYASEFAKEHRLRVCLVLSRRISVYFAEDGSFRYASEAGLTTRFHTNATLLDKACSRELIAAGLDQDSLRYHEAGRQRDGDPGTTSQAAFERRRPLKLTDHGNLSQRNPACSSNAMVRCTSSAATTMTAISVILDACPAQATDLP